jgi:alanine racemase
MPRAWIDVDLGALVRNAQRLRAHAGVPVLPMVKADAYGLGMIPVATALRAVDPWAFGVATVDEGIQLRHAGFRERIVLFTPSLQDELHAAKAHDLTPTLGDPALIRAWGPTKAAWHLTIDTGMQRGVPWDEVPALRELLLAHPPQGVFTHYHSPDASPDSVVEQDRRFAAALAALPSRPPVIHTDNSAAIARRGPSAHDVVRPGVFLYGVGDSEFARPEPVVAIHARILELHAVKPGESVSYGATWVATRDSVVATIGLGYADGFRRGASNVGRVRVAGALAPVIGLINMDLTLVDVTDLPATVGDHVSVVGAEPALHIEAVARRAGVSAYEFLTGLRLRLPRRYL